jgi:glycosyltransferase involved in cell wall biosynthesis
MNVSIIIPAYNNAKTIRSVLEALKKQEYSKGQFEIIVIDDKSKDSTAELSNLDGVRAVQNPQNYGLAYSINKGINLAKYEIVVTLHADTIPLSRTWLSDLVTPLADPSIAACCSLQESPDVLNGRLSLWEKLLLARLDVHGAFNDKADAYKKEILAELGYFDYKTFRTAGEDEDLALRLRQSKKKIIVTNARVLHDHYDNYSTNSECLKKLLSKEYTFGRAGGALRRKFPFHKPGSYIYPDPRFLFSDGLFRSIICIGSFVPFVQILCLPVLIVFSLPGVVKTVKRTRLYSALLLYPVFNIMRYLTYTAGYLVGLATSKQK